MGIFKKKIFSRISNEDLFRDIYPPEVKEDMKMLGIEPGEQTRELFGWTEQDDIEAQEIQLSKKRRQLEEAKLGGATLREIMALEISIKGTENWLKENKQT